MSALEMSEIPALTPAALHALGQELLQMTALTCLALHAEHRFLQKRVGAQVAALPLPSGLRSLTVANIKWGVRAHGEVAALGQRLRKLPHLTQLHFESKATEVLAALASRLSALPALQDVRLCGVGFSDTTSWALVITAAIRQLTSSRGWQSCRTS
jgi:hypothetical protein